MLPVIFDLKIINFRNQPMTTMRWELLRTFSLTSGSSVRMSYTHLSYLHFLRNLRTVSNARCCSTGSIGFLVRAVGGMLVMI